MHLPLTLDKNNPWNAVYCIAGIAFIMSTSEFIPIGILPNIALSFQLNVATIGLMVTIYAWLVAFLSIPLILITDKFNRYQLLISVLIIFICCQFLSSIAWNYSVLMVSRMGLAVAHAIFWGIAIPLAVRLAPMDAKTKAISSIMIGTAIAAIMGIPLGTLLGQNLNWRLSLLLITISACIMLGLIIKILPRSLPSKNKTLLKSLPSLIKRKNLITLYILLLLIITGHFTAYTYFTPYMREVGLLNKNWVVVLLLIFGIASIFAGIIFPKIKESYQYHLWYLSSSIIFLCLISLEFTSPYIAWIILLCFIWGLSYTLTILILQNQTLNLTPDATDLAIAIFSSISNIGIGLGALIGTQTILNLQINYIGYIAAGFVLLTLIILIFFSFKSLNESTGY